jgi:hypothetical protein
LTDISMTGADLSMMEFLRARCWRFAIHTPALDLERFEALTITATQAPDLAVLPGQAATVDAIGREKERDALVDLVRQFAAQGLSWTAGTTVAVSPDTAIAARAFFNALPITKSLPRISPDEDGGLTMVWEGRGDPLLAVLDGWRIHLVDAAATPRARYFDDLPFDGEQIPRVVLDALPTR